MTTVDSPSARLRTALGLLLPSLTRTSRNFWDHESLALLYPRYLVMIHSTIRASVPLMETALAVTRERYQWDPVCEVLEDYLVKHIPEELGHDQWVLEDLERLGVPTDVALKAMPSPSVAALVGSQYYYIHHVHPVLLLGYIAVLEGYPPLESLAIEAARRTGYPIEAFRTLRKHANLDPFHRQDLDRTLDRLPCDGQLWGRIRANALQTTFWAQKITEELLSEQLSTVTAGRSEFQ